MFHHAEEKDRDAILGYLRREPEINLFIIGDILTYGLRSEIIDIFTQDAAREYDAVLLRYRNSLVPYTHSTKTDLSDTIAQINSFLADGGAWVVSGKKEVVDGVKARLSRRPSTEKNLFFSLCRALQPVQHLHPLAQRATGEDADDIADLLVTIQEFSSAGMDRRAFREETEKGHAVRTIVRDPGTGQVLSVASAVAESDASAMIVGVATRIGHRGRGYATACLYQLVSDLQKRGKSACLFYDNPAAGKIYHRLGFSDMGMWEMLTFAAK